MELTHASFFSGVGGLDLGLERAGWRTVSFSEIDPYASAVLAERWPGVPNLGDITRLAESVGQQGVEDHVAGSGGNDAGYDASSPWHGAFLWSGGFPCQDLSVAGKRRGFHDEDGNLTRSGLAHAFLDLVERHRPPAILLENVPGLLSSHGGKDLGALLSRLGELGYWWAYRILDAQFFGVPQRRRRVFICALHAGAGFRADSAAAVLSVGARCGGHSAAGDQTGPGASDRFADGVAGAGPLPQAVTAKWYRGSSGPAGDEHHNMVVANGLRASDGHHGYSSPRGDGGDNLIAHSVRPRSGMPQGRNSNLRVERSSPDADRVRAADGLAGRLDDREVVGTLTAPNVTAKPIDGKRQDGSRRDRIPTSAQSLDTKRGGADDNEAQAGHLVAGNGRDVVAGTRRRGLDLLPLGLDSHRYRCCGNGVVSNVAEWIGVRLAQAVSR